MFHKTYEKRYMSRAQTRAMSIDHPIGDPFGGAAYREMNDPLSAAVMVGGNLIGSAISGSAAESAARTQAKAAKEAQEQQLKIYEQQNAQLAPVRATGYQALTTLGSMLPGQYQQYDAQGNPIGTGTGTGSLVQTFGPEQLKTNLAPNYEFMRDQGLGATMQAMNASGGGSNITRGATKFAEDYASNAYQNAFNNFQTQQSNIYNRLAGIAGLGQAGQAQSNTLASNYANAATGLTTGAAAAQAAGNVGMANAISGGITGAGQTYALSQLMKPSSSISDDYKFAVDKPIA